MTPDPSLHPGTFYQRLRQLTTQAQRGHIPSLIEHPHKWVEGLRLMGIQIFLQSSFPQKHPSWHRLQFPDLKGKVLPREDVTNHASLLNHLDISHICSSGGVIHPQDRVKTLSHVLSQEEEQTLWCRDVLAPEGRMAIPVTTSFDGAFPLLGMALAKDGLALHLEDNQERTLHLVDTPGSSPLYSTDVGQHLTHVVCLEKGSCLLLVEEIIQGGGQLSNHTTHIALKPGAEMVHIRLLREDNTQETRESRESVGISTALVSVEKGARYQGINWLTSQSFGRLQTRVLLEEEEAEAYVASFMIGEGNSRLSTMVRIDHRAPKTRSIQEARALMGEHSLGILHGTTHVASMMEKSQARQMFRGIVLNPRAGLEVQPHLDLFNGDITCTHGVSMGALDAKSLGYLTQRGFDRKTAEALLYQAFLQEALEASLENPSNLIKEIFNILLKTSP